MTKKERVVVVGASPKAERYSNKAVRLLLEHGHEVFPVHPAVESIEGLTAIHDLGEINGPVDTITMYLSPAQSTALAEKLIKLKPGRVIFNPGTENAELESLLADNHIPTEKACTLVLLNTSQF